jgi:hypothetical protein
MPNDPPKIVLPPLTPAELSSRDFQEMKLNGELSGCWHGEDSDVRRALDLLRTYVVVIFEMQLKVYRAHSSYSTLWIPKIMEESISRVARCLRNHSNDSPSNLLQVLGDTLLYHMRTHPMLVNHADLMRTFPPPPLLGNQASGYAASESPLLMYVQEQQMAAAQIPENASGKSTQAAPDLSEAERRANLLAEYKKATGNPSNRKIYMAQNSSIHKPEFYQWKNGNLPANSRATMRFEAFLKSRRKPIPRNPTSEV